MQHKQKPRRPGKGFERAFNLVSRQIRSAGESRGFAEARLLTQWAEIAGPEMAGICQPVKVSHTRGALGATLVVLTTGAQAPMLQAQLPKLRARVNACYGYAAIGHIRITQTAATGFSEGKIQFTAAPAPAPVEPASDIVDSARETTADIRDKNLQAALESLGRNVLTKSRKTKGQKS